MSLVQGRGAALDVFRQPFAVTFDILTSADAGTGVVSGCAVSAQGTPDMTVAVASGSVLVGNTPVSVSAGNVTITAADALLNRLDLVVVNSSGTKSVTAGTAHAFPVPPSIPANSAVLAFVYVPAADTTISSTQIHDTRIFVVDPGTQAELTAAIAAEVARADSTYLQLDDADSAYAPSAKITPPAPLSIISDFQSGHGWTAANVLSSDLNHTTDFVFGSQSAKIVAPSSSGSGLLQKSGLSLDLTGRQLVLWVKVDDMATVGGITMRIGADLTTNYYTLTPSFGAVTYSALGSNEWVPVTFGWNQATTTGSPSRAAIAAIQLRLATVGAATPSMWVNRLASEPEPLTTWPNGVVSVAFDDLWDSVWTLGKPRLDLYGFPATLYAIAEVAGTAGRLTVAQMQQAQRLNRWEIAAHAYSTAAHDAPYTGLTEAQIEVDAVAMKRWLSDNGFRGGDHFAYPQGQFNDTVEAVVRRFFASARMTTNTPRQTWPPRQTTRIRALNVTAAMSAASITAEIDAAYDNKTWLILVFHKIVASGASGATEYNTADYNTVVDYLSTKGIPVRTVGDVLATEPDRAGTTGKTGATATPLLLGGGTVSGPPTTGTHLEGELVVDDNGDAWRCTVEGAPGTWALVNARHFGGLWPSGSYQQTEGSPSTSLLTQAQVRYSPIWLPRAGTVTEIAIDMTVSGAANSVTRVGICAPDANGRPSALLGDGGTIDTTVAAALLAKTGLSIAVPAGLIWVAVVGQGSPATQPTLRVMTGWNRWVNLTTLSTSGNRTGYVESGVTGALATAVPSLTTNTFGCWAAVKLA